TTLILEHLQRYAATQPVPPDLCYTHNFEDGRRPRLLRVPAGCGARLKADMETLVRELQIAIPRAFDSVEYGEQRDRI
ncbi:MAG TPA: AAA family ATPase, partial [Anaerolineales bacterium]|nr:AAA family ATPase [Anaerolineales bacterium]